jgi:mRNA-degrading endonuclease toxin of MazEF toxin-antitoxin module
VVALVTRTPRGLPTEGLVGKPEGLPRPSVVNTDNILTVPRQRLARLMGQFSSAKIDELDRALKIALRLDS